MQNIEINNLLGDKKTSIKQLKQFRLLVGNRFIKVSGGKEK